MAHDNPPPYGHSEAITSFSTHEPQAGTETEKSETSFTENLPAHDNPAFKVCMVLVLM